MKKLDLFIEETMAAAGSISPARRDLLGHAAAFLRSAKYKQGRADLIFICTHNSRRSHFAQVWCQIAAHHLQLDGIHAWSGGTEVTACDIRTIRALQRAGLSIDAPTGLDNPVYLARYAPDRQPLPLYSKTYDSPENPASSYAAMMCCSDVDAGCPIVHGAGIRIPLHYRDPKESDRTSMETEVYDQRCREIAIEMFYLVSRTKG